jgi:hypothetical protein
MSMRVALRRLPLAVREETVQPWNQDKRPWPISPFGSFALQAHKSHQRTNADVLAVAIITSRNPSRPQGLKTSNGTFSLLYPIH